MPTTRLESDSGIHSESPMPPEVVKLLGHGSYGVVYQGIVLTERMKKSKIAVKEISKADKPPAKLASVLREIDLQSTLRHPNIIRVLGTHETSDSVYILMEYAKRGELFHAVAKTGKLSETVAATMAWQIMSAIEHCHCNGIVHRDVKPENILLDSNYNVKLSDFGLAVHLPANRQLNEACGSVLYAAPEMFNGANYNHSVDIWSFGVTLYVMVTGKNPWGANNNDIEARMNCITRGKYIPPTECSHEVQDLISQCLRVNPVDRCSIVEIKNHSWFRKNLPSWAQSQLDFASPSNIMVERSAIDEFADLKTARSGASSNSSSILSSTVSSDNIPEPTYIPSPLGNSGNSDIPRGRRTTGPQSQPRPVN